MREAVLKGIHYIGFNYINIKVAQIYSFLAKAGARASAMANACASVSASLEIKSPTAFWQHSIKS